MPNIAPDRVRAILEDLYALDPSLRAQGDDLAKIVTELMAAKPDATVDQRFVSSLRARLQERASAPISFTLNSFMNKFKILVPVSVVAVVAIVAVTVVNGNPALLQRFARPSSSSSPTEGLMASRVVVTRAGANAFGSLVGDNAGGQPSAESSGMGGGGYAVRNQSGGGGGNAALSSIVPTTAPMPPAMDAKMVAPGTTPGFAPDSTYERLRFVYEGDDLTLEPTATVYRRDKHSLNASNVSSALRGMSVGPVNLDRFSNVNLQQFTLSQTGPMSYQIYVDLNEGMVNITDNWATWPHPENNCRDQECYDRLRIRPEEVPADDALVAIANDFMKDHGISTEAYDAPVVDRRWNVMQPYMKDVSASEAALRIYVPDVVTLIYPVKIEGVIAYDQSGFPFGLSVSVDVRNKKVRSIWNLTPQSYQSSAYDAITDQKQILDVASRGDAYSGAFGVDPNEKIVDVKIGTPERVLVQAYHFGQDGQGEELLVPALRFPILPGQEANTYGRDSVVVPLVKDLLNPPVTILETGVSARPEAAPGVATPPPTTTLEPPKGE